MLERGSGPFSLGLRCVYHSRLAARGEVAGRVHESVEGEGGRINLSFLSAPALLQHQLVVVVVGELRGTAVRSKGVLGSGRKPGMVRVGSPIMSSFRRV